MNLVLAWIFALAAGSVGVQAWAQGGVAQGMAPPPANDTTFFTAEELATPLRHNLVWIGADDIGEHGFGLVVGGTAETLWVVTARHVVVKTAMLGSGVPDQPSSQIRLRLCALPDGRTVQAQPWAAWSAGGEDIALLSVARPAGYEWATRVLAARAGPGDDVWLLGSNDECARVPVQGRVRAAADAAHNLRIDFTGVQGGSSGGPVFSGSGIVGLMKSAEDLTTTVHDVADIQSRVQSTPGAVWQLVDARNISPTDPRAAQIDLAETLNQYLLALSNIQMLFQLPQVARVTQDDYIRRYNLALQRFLKVRETYNGTLARDGSPDALPAWLDLSASLWAMHQNFWRLNAEMTDVYRSQQTTPDIRARMLALEPERARLEARIAQFLRLLNQGK